MARGKVKKWFRDRGTGFITDAADGVDVFFGDRSLQGLRPEEIQVGLEVEFDRGEGPKGANPPTVRRAAGPPPQAPPPPRPARAAPVSPPPGPEGELPLPRSLQRLLGQVPVAQRHPGLQLNKYLVPCLSQEKQKDVL